MIVAQQFTIHFDCFAVQQLRIPVFAFDVQRIGHIVQAHGDLWMRSVRVQDALHCQRFTEKFLRLLVVRRHESKVVQSFGEVGVRAIV